MSKKCKLFDEKKMQNQDPVRTESTTLAETSNVTDPDDLFGTLLGRFFFPMVLLSVADPGSGAFLTPGSGIRDG